MLARCSWLTMSLSSSPSNIRCQPTPSRYPQKLTDMRENITQALIPPLSLLFSAVIFGTVLHTKHQSYRRYLTPIFLFSAYHCLATPHQFSFCLPLFSLWDLGIGLYVLHALSLFHIEQWPAPTPPVNFSSTLQKYKWKGATTYRLWGNPRVFIPSKEARERKQQTYKAFDTYRIAKAVLYYTLLSHVAPAIDSRLIGPIQPADVNNTQRTFFRSLLQALVSNGKGFQSAAPLLEPRSVLLRAHTALFWILESVAYLDGANALLGLFFVCVAHVDDPADWPPLFGSPAAVVSLTAFWREFWHPLATRPYGNIGRMIARRVFGLDTANSSAAKTIIAAVVFTLSGCTHAVVTWQGGFPDWHLEIWWFVANFCACALETGVRALYRKKASRSRVLRYLQRDDRVWITRVLGRLWVFAFFCWSVPKWQYARLERQAIARQEIERLRRILSL